MYKVKTQAADCDAIFQSGARPDGIIGSESFTQVLTIYNAIDKGLY